MPVIEARGLAKEFRPPFRRTGVRAVRDLDLQVDRGRVFGLLGPNGSGKTTTILMLLGLLKPTSGHAVVLGHPAGHKEARRRTGFLPEETRLYEFLTGVETLHFVGRLFGLNRATRRRRAEELLRRTGMWEARDRRLATYSKGMARRIGLAQALVARPELLVLDEPTSGLDPVGNREVRDLLREVAAAGATVLLTSHILSDVADVCDEIAILHQGRKILVGEVSELLADADRMVWETDAVDDARRTRLERQLETEGIRLHGTRPPRTTLEALFLDALARDREDVGGA
ncbi:MAG: ABC transporter ATP-binding protein [Planctomycetota bacterium]|jgi:ABC-2 type transport system ATP-binding protein